MYLQVNVFVHFCNPYSDFITIKASLLCLNVFVYFLCQQPSRFDQEMSDHSTKRELIFSILNTGFLYPTKLYLKMCLKYCAFLFVFGLCTQLFSASRGRIKCYGFWMLLKILSALTGNCENVCVFVSRSVCRCV